jgi:uncharacterized membrane protein YecN with MAPEG domain
MYEIFRQFARAAYIVIAVLVHMSLSDDSVKPYRTRYPITGETGLEHTQKIIALESKFGESIYFILFV